MNWASFVNCTVNFLAKNAASIMVGLVSSAIVAVFFYRLSARDSEALYRRRQLDSVLLRLKQLDPRRRRNIRGQDGVSDTAHWMICLSEIMDESGFRDGADALRRIVCEMEGKTPEAPQQSSLTEKEAEEVKRKWETQIRNLYAREHLSRLNRSRSHSND